MLREATAIVLSAVLVASPFIRGATTRQTKSGIKIREADAPVVREIDTPQKQYHPHATNLGEFKLTAYCACSECCGKPVWDDAYGITASGTTVKQGRTVAVDPDVIPLGSILYINGDRYVAEDTGGAVEGNHVDIYFDSHEDALAFGVQYADVWIWR